MLGDFCLWSLCCCSICGIVGRGQLRFLRRSLYNIDNVNAGTLALHVARSGSKLENTSLTTDGSIVPAYDIVYIVQLGFENREFCNCLSRNELL